MILYIFDFPQDPDSLMLTEGPRKSYTNMNTCLLIFKGTESIILTKEYHCDRSHTSQTHTAGGYSQHLHT